MSGCQGWQADKGIIAERRDGLAQDNPFVAVGSGHPFQREPTDIAEGGAAGWLGDNEIGAYTITIDKKHGSILMHQAMVTASDTLPTHGVCKRMD